MPSGTVLVVDDDAAIQEVLTDALAQEGYRVISSIDGASLAVARDTQPGVILLDLLMPGMGGAEVSRRLRADAATAHIPVIAMSGAHQDGAALGFLADDWLDKPFSLDALGATVARWMPPDGEAVTR